VDGKRKVKITSLLRQNTRVDGKRKDKSTSLLRTRVDGKEKL
jgi:hypothetical protein